MEEVDLKSRANELIEDIFLFKSEKCKDLSLIDTIIEYSFKHNLPLQEVGNVLADHKEFVSILEKQLEKEGYIRVYGSDKSPSVFDDEW